MVTTYKREYLAELPDASAVGTTLSAGGYEDMTNNAPHASDLWPAPRISSNTSVGLTCVEVGGYRYYEPDGSTAGSDRGLYYISLETRVTPAGADAERLEFDLQINGLANTTDWLWPDGGAMATSASYRLTNMSGAVVGNGFRFDAAGDLFICATAVAGRLRWVVRALGHYQYGLLPDKVIAGDWTHWEVRRIPISSGYLVVVIVDGHGIFAAEFASLTSVGAWYISGGVLNNWNISGIEAATLRIANIKLSRLYEAEATAPTVEATATTGEASATITATVNTGTN